MFSSAYIKGHSHLKCDDYALHSQNCAFLSDGCSGSPNSDIGSKILPYFAIDNIYKYLLKHFQISFKEYYDILSYILSSQYSGVLFDCTLGGIVIHEKWLYTSFLGDGVFYIEWSNGEKIIEKISYDKNYPFYFSYLMDTSKYDQWIGVQQNFKKIELIYDNFERSSFEQFSKEELSNNISERSLPLEEVKLCVLFSDGVEQVDNMNLVDVVKELTDFKNFNTDFAWRRLKRFEEIQKKKGNFCQDDISMIVYKKG